MSKKNKHTQHEEENGEAWLLPYSDLMTLLLAVFIVLFAVSQIDAEKAQMMSDEFSKSMMNESFTLSRANESKEPPPQSPASDEGSESSESSLSGETEVQKMEALKTELDAKFQSEHMTASVTTSIDKRGLVISLNNAVFFEPGSAEIKKENEDTLMEIAVMISVMDNYIRIEGHTDNIPMNSDLYPSNWDLSAARAANVVRLFSGQPNASPEKLIAVGYGEYRPIADNSTAEGRAKNRRIDIIILNDKYSDLEKELIR